MSRLQYFVKKFLVDYYEPILKKLAMSHPAEFTSANCPCYIKSVSFDCTEKKNGEIKTKKLKNIWLLFFSWAIDVTI